MHVRFPTLLDCDDQTKESILTLPPFNTPNLILELLVELGKPCNTTEVLKCNTTVQP